MRSTAESLLSRARDAGTVRPELTVDDLLALASGAAIASTSTRHAQQLSRFLRRGFETAEANRPHRRTVLQ
jgi:hypothetical protein